MFFLYAKWVTLALVFSSSLFGSASSDPHCWERLRAESAAARAPFIQDDYAAVRRRIERGFNSLEQVELLTAQVLDLPDAPQNSNVVAELQSMMNFCATWKEGDRKDGVLSAVDGLEAMIAIRLVDAGQVDDHSIALAMEGLYHLSFEHPSTPKIKRPLGNTPADKVLGAIFSGSDPNFYNPEHPAREWAKRIVPKVIAAGNEGKLDVDECTSLNLLFTYDVQATPDFFAYHLSYWEILEAWANDVNAPFHDFAVEKALEQARQLLHPSQRPLAGEYRDKIIHFFLAEQARSPESPQADQIRKSLGKLLE